MSHRRCVCLEADPLPIHAGAQSKICRKCKGWFSLVGDEIPEWESFAWYFEAHAGLQEVE